MIICRCFCVGFIDFMLKGKGLLDNKILIFPDNFEKNDKIILKYFQCLKRWKNYIVLFAVSTENLENLKYFSLRKSSCFYYLLLSVKLKKEKYLKKKNQFKY